jgi:signal transduction histidine kinase
VLAAALVAAAAPALPAAAAGDGDAVQKSLLIINSADAASPLQTAITNGLIARLADAARPLVFNVEFLDGYRFPLVAAEARLERTIAEKYGDRPPDVVVAIGPEALRFAAGHGAVIGPRTPIVFAVNGTDDSPVPAVPPHAAGLIGRIHVGATLDLISRMQPETRTLAVIAGSGHHDMQLLAATRKGLGRIPGRFDVVELVGLPAADLVARLATLPPDAAILFLTLALDRDGTRYASAEVARRVTAATTLPTYAIYETTIGQGIVGGYLYRPRLIAGQLGAIVRRVLDGEAPERIGVHDAASSAAVIDWRVLEHVGVDPEGIPADAVILNRQPSPWQQYRPQILGLAILFAGLVALLLAVPAELRRRRRMEESLRAITGSVLTARDEERRRIARELHDSTGQNIAAASLLLGRLRAAVPEAARSDADDLDGILKRSMAEIRTLSYVLHPPLLDEGGLGAALPHFVEEFTRRSGIAVDLEIELDLARLPDEAELALFRIVQEGLNNVSRHAKGRSARIRLGRDRDQGSRAVILRIEDDGDGFPGAGRAPEARPVERQSWGVGIASMEERLRPLGGQLRILSGAGRTVVTAVVPLRAPNLPAE